MIPRTEALQKFETLARRAADSILEMPLIKAKSLENRVKIARAQWCVAAAGFANPFEALPIASRDLDRMTDAQLEERIRDAIYNTAIRLGFMGSMP